MTVEGHRRWRAWLFSLCLCLAGPLAAAEGLFTFAYVQRAHDPYYASQRAYTGLSLRERQRPVAGAQLGVRDSRITGRALGLEFELLEVTLGPGEQALTAIDALAAERGTFVFLLDLPIEEVTALGAAFAARELLAFNVRHTADRLREQDCSANLFHTMPSEAMLMDALSQFLVFHHWKEVLVLEGDSEADQQLSRSFQRSARKFRIDISARRAFVLGNDPRLRDRNNIALLTAGTDYDVVFVADSVGEFGRYVPYSSQSPRPVVGSEGLLASAWHWTWERHGAPQLSQRFDRSAGRRMQDMDYAAWAAVKAVVESIARTGRTDYPAVRAYLTSKDFTLDTYKGAPGSFRPWDNQLRQPILLHTHNAVIAEAPIEGFLHQHNNLDTLGIDRRESTCRKAD
jgi:ABC transporter substrate binding protein (PQQ-dependent alcohol dehydrogenase system)